MTPAMNLPQLSRAANGFAQRTRMSRETWSSVAIGCAIVGASALALPESVLGGITGKLAGLAVIAFAILHAARVGSADRMGWGAVALGMFVFAQPVVFGWTDAASVVAIHLLAGTMLVAAGTWRLVWAGDYEPQPAAQDPGAPETASPAEPAVGASLAKGADGWTWGAIATGCAVLGASVVILSDSLAAGLAAKVAGLAVIAMALLHAARVHAARPLAWLSLALGAVVVAKPFVIGFAAVTGAVAIHLVAGAMLATVGAVRLFWPPQQEVAAD